MYDLTFIGLCILVALLLYLYLVPHHNLPYPPGPKPWPIIGNLPLLAGRNNLEVFTELASKYGPVVFVRMAGTKVLLLNSMEVIKEAFVKKGDAFNNKPTNTVISHMNKNTGILSSNGNIWKEHRRFTVMWLRNLGLGKRKMESPIKTEIAELLQAIETLEEKPFNPRTLLSPSILNVTWALVAGQRFSLDDPKLHQLMNAIHENLQLGVQSGYLNIMPWLRFFPVIGDSYWKMEKNLNSVYAFLHTVIDEHKATLDNFGDDSDLLREYLKQVRKNADEGNIEKAFTEIQIRRVMLDLFVAGSETTVTTLCWAMLILVREIELQCRLQNEIDEVIGLGRLPSPDDRSKMPFTEAFLAEVQRYGGIVPLITHATNDASSLHGYYIPKDTVVLANLWSLTRDPNLWENPELFDPDRFLDSEGNFQKPEHHIPFSVGKRACLGESLARMELFLYLTCLLQKFSFYAMQGIRPTLEHVPGVTMSPKPFELIARLR